MLMSSSRLIGGKVRYRFESPRKSLTLAGLRKDAALPRFPSIVT
jgi:hypothetical protein